MVVHIGVVKGSLQFLCQWALPIINKAFPLEELLRNQEEHAHATVALLPTRMRSDDGRDAVVWHLVIAGGTLLFHAFGSVMSKIIGVAAEEVIVEGWRALMKGLALFWRAFADDFKSIRNGADAWEQLTNERRSGEHKADEVTSPLEEMEELSCARQVWVVTGAEAIKSRSAGDHVEYLVLVTKTETSSGVTATIEVTKRYSQFETFCAELDALGFPASSYLPGKMLLSSTETKIKKRVEAFNTLLAELVAVMDRVQNECQNVVDMAVIQVTAAFLACPVKLPS